MKLKTALLGIVSFAIISSAPMTTNAYTDNAGVMNHFNYDNTQYLYDYLNSNDFRFYNNRNFYDSYIKKDNSIFLTISKEPLGGMGPWWRQQGMMGYLIILKPGYPTDKGIEVGMDWEKITDAYGVAYKPEKDDIYENDPGTGYFTENSYTFKTDYGQEETLKYYLITHFDREGHWLQFLVDKSSKKIIAIGYFRGRPRFGGAANTMLPANLSDWGLWRFVLSDRIKEHPLKSGWRAISDAWKGL